MLDGADIQALEKQAPEITLTISVVFSRIMPPHKKEIAGLGLSNPNSIVPHIRTHAHRTTNAIFTSRP